jgi:uncharacterized protein (TIGR03437 family)
MMVRQFLKFLRFGLFLALSAVPAWALSFTSTTCDAVFFSTYGQPIVITATVTSSDPGVPTGTMTVSDGGSAIGSTALTANGTAKITAAFTTLGTHMIVCGYSGDAMFAASMSAPVSITVGQATPKIELTFSQNPVTVGQTVDINVRLSGLAGVPNGSVTLLDGSTVLAVMLLFLEADDSTAQFSTSTLAAGTHLITASYGGDMFFVASTSPQLALVVGRRPTKTAILRATPLADSQSSTIQVQVTSDTGTPTGTVTLTESVRTLARGTLVNGLADIALTGLSAGTHSLVATYSGDDLFAVSTSAPFTLQVNAAPTVTLLAASPNPAQVGQLITFTGTVTSTAGIPIGTVTFQGSSGAIGTASLNTVGQAALTASFGAPGTQTLTAAYSGSPQFAASTSLPLTLTITPRQLTTLSAASGSATVSPDSLVSIYGDHLVSSPVSAALLPWPTTLGGVSAVFRDSTGVERLAALKYVSPGQINAVVPPDAPPGQSAVIVRTGAVDLESGMATIADTAPALFSGDGSGTGGAAALVYVFRANGSVTFTPTFRCDGHGSCSTNPIDMGGDGDVAVLELYATGLRRAAPAVLVRVAGQDLTPLYAGPQPQYGGVDQVNVILPPSLRGAGEVTVSIVIGSQLSNTVTIRLQ